MTYNLIKLVILNKDNNLDKILKTYMQYMSSYPIGYSFPLNSNVRIIENETKEYKLINNKITFYVCQNYSCIPPSYDINKII